MAYTLSWHIPDQVLHVAVKDQLSVKELQDINENILAILDSGQTKRLIVMDATHLQASHQTAFDLRDTQKYRDHPRLDCLLVVADNKLNRLITLIAFCTSRAHFMQFDDFHKAEIFLKNRGTAIVSKT